MEFVAHATEAQSGGNNGLKSLIDQIFTKLESLRESDINGNSAELSSIASKLKQNFHSYEPYPRTPLIHFARAVDPCFSINVLEGGNLF